MEELLEVKEYVKELKELIYLNHANPHQVPFIQDPQMRLIYQWVVKIEENIKQVKLNYYEGI